MFDAFTYTHEADGFWIGYWNDYPDLMTQGHTLDELKLMLDDIRDAILDGVLDDTAASRQ